MSDFAEFSESIYQPNSTTLPDYPLPIDNINIQINHIKEAEIRQATKELKNRLMAGVDGIPSFFIKDWIGALAEAMKIIFNLTLRTRTFAERWNETKVILVVKSDNKVEMNNCRQISIIFNFSKLFENAIHNGNINSLRGNCHQTTMGSRSTVTNLAFLGRVWKFGKWWTSRCDLYCPHGV